MFKNRPSLPNLVRGLPSLQDRGRRSRTSRRTLSCPERLETRTLFCATEMSIAPWLDTAGDTAQDQAAEVSSPLPGSTATSTTSRTAPSSAATDSPFSTTATSTPYVLNSSNGRTMPVESSTAGDRNLNVTTLPANMRRTSDLGHAAYDDGEFDDGGYENDLQSRQIRNLDTSPVTVGDNFFDRIGIDFDTAINEPPTADSPVSQTSPNDAPTPAGDSMETEPSSSIEIDLTDLGRTTPGQGFRPANLADLELLEDAAMRDAERLRQVDLSASLLIATDDFFDRLGVDFDENIDDRLRTTGGDIVSDSPRTPPTDVPRLSDSRSEGVAGRLLRQTKSLRADSPTVELKYNFDYVIQDLRRAGI